MAEAIIPLIGSLDEDGGGGAAGAAIGVISSLMIIAQGTAQLNDTGQPTDRIAARRDQLKTALVNSTNAYLRAFDGIQERIVSDWGKMSTVAKKANDPQEWLLSDADLEYAVAAYDRGAKFHFWSALMRALYKRFVVLPGFMYDPVTHQAQFPGEKFVDSAWQVACCSVGFHPFGLSRHTLGDEWLHIGFWETSDGRIILQDYLNVWAVMPPGGPKDRWCTDTASVPSEELTKELRKSPEEGGPGLYMPWFWNQFDPYYQLNSFDTSALWPNCEAEAAE